MLAASRASEQIKSRFVRYVSLADDQRNYATSVTAMAMEGGMLLSYMQVLELIYKSTMN